MTDKAPQYDHVDDSFITAKCFNQPVTPSAVLAEFSNHVSMKSALTADPALLVEWSKKIRSECLLLKSCIKSAGFVRVPPPTVVRCVSYTELVERWFPYLALTARDSSLGLWNGRFRACTTKKEVLESFCKGECVREVLDFLAFTDDLHRYLRSENSDPGRGLPIVVYGKKEPFPYRKVLQGRHRTIGMPDWAMLMIETSYNTYEKINAAGVPTLCNLDTAAGTQRFTENPLFYHVYGGDTTVDLDLIKKRRPGVRCLDYDVEAWDRSLLEPIILALYEGIISDEGDAGSVRLAKALAYGINSRGAYVLPTGVFMLPADLFAWCSGALLTLLGNSLIHQSLLKLFGLEGIVCGDDGNVFVDRNPVSAEQLTSMFASVGLKLKMVEEVEGLHFCKVWHVGDVSEVDVSEIVKKILASHGKDWEVARDAVEMYALHGDGTIVCSDLISVRGQTTLLLPSAPLA